MHWCKVYTSGMRTTGKIVPPTKHRYRTEDLIMFCRCLVVGNEWMSCDTHTLNNDMYVQINGNGDGI
jgi:hypothetical protein